MLFNLKTKTLQNVSAYSKNSAKILFCNTNAKFEKLIKSNKINISSLQNKNFKDDENSELQIWNSNNPNLLIIKKASIDKKFNVD